MECILFNYGLLTFSRLWANSSVWSLVKKLRLCGFFFLQIMIISLTFSFAGSFFLHVCWSNWPNFHSFHFSFNTKPLHRQGEGGVLAAVWIVMHGKMRRLLKAVQWHFPRIAAWQQRPPDVHVYFSEPVENNKIQKKLESWNTREAKKEKHQIGIFRFLSRNAELNRCPWVEWTRATWFRSSPRTSGTEGTIKVSSIHFFQLNIGWTFSFSALCDIFDKVDLSGNGTISIAEYVSMCQVCKLFSA